ncbi:MAG TPA: hypothetical protein PKH07_18455 [bacterium]|nr:hypothetical protein [bacterium]
MSATDQNDNQRKEHKAEYCQSCGACPAGQASSRGASTAANEEIEALVREVTREVLKHLKSVEMKP